MILSIAGVVSGSDLSPFVERDKGTFEIDAAVGKRMDTLRFTMFDPGLTLSVPDRAEVWVYDAPALGGGYASAILADAPVFYARMNDPVGSTVAKDSSVNNAAGSYLGGAQPGLPGLSSDGSRATGYASAGNMQTPNLASRFTGASISIRIRFMALPGGGVLVDEYSLPNGSAWHYSAIEVLASGMVRVGMWTGTLDQGINLGVVTFGSIHEAWLVYDRPGTTLYGYLDGVLAASASAFTRIVPSDNHSTDTPPTAAVYYNVGVADLSTNLGNGGGFNGIVSDFAIYNGVVSAARVAAQYAAASGSSPVVDPPGAISAYNTWRNGVGSEVTSTTPANWTTRMFAGYVATPDYSVIGPQRYVAVHAQDYTYRLRSTVCNKAYVSGMTDKAIIQDIFAAYRKDVDTANVTAVVSSMPAISFPVHSLEQFMERVIKVSRAIYRVDYYKRLYYGIIGQQVAPFNLSDQPDGITTFGMEEPVHYAPDGSGLANRAWVVGARYLGMTQAYQIPPTDVNGQAFQFTLPGDPDITGMTITVAGVDQGVGVVAPAGGDITSQSSYKANWIISHTPPIVALKVTPTAGQAIIVTGKFRYPLVTVVSDPTLVALSGGNIFETVIRDRRINDLGLAQQVGNAFLKNQGLSMKGGTCTVRKRGLGGALLQPGQQILITHRIMFGGGALRDAGGNPITTMTALVTRLHMRLDTDANEPYGMEINFADRQVGGGY